MDRSAVTQRVWELAEPLALAGGLELVDVQYRPEGGRIVLRLLLDRPEGGVTLDEQTRAPIGGRRRFRGTLEAATAEEITLHDPDAGRVAIALGAIEKAHVDHDFSRPAGPPHAHSVREAPCCRT